MPPTTHPRPDSAHRDSPNNAYVALLIVIVFSWVAWTAFWDTGLYGDNVEQFIWSHSVQWGYHKHPPLPTWLLAGLIGLVGPAWWLANALSAVCVVTTGVLTWLIARRLVSLQVANITAVLWGLQQGFSVTAHIYNHNTVMVMWLAAATYCLIRALADTYKTSWWWLGMGTAAGCAMLTKYQAALPLAALAIAAVVVARQRQISIGWPLAAAAGTFCALLAPHVYWGYSQQFPHLKYAAEIVESGGFLKRLSWQLTFAVNQIRMNLPLIGALLLSGVWVLIGTRVRVKPSDLATSPSHVLPASYEIRSSATAAVDTHLWFWVLLWGPLAVVLTLSFVTGSPLRNHWGVQLFQFLPLWVAARWHTHRFLQLKPLVVCALLMHAVGLTYYAVKQNADGAVLADRRADSSYPAQKMSDAAVAHWKSATACPLKLVAGDFEAGLVSAFSKEFPPVFINRTATPWISEADLQKFGTLYVLTSSQVMPPDAAPAFKWTIATSKNGTVKQVQFGVRLPSKPC